MTKLDKYSIEDVRTLAREVIACVIGDIPDGLSKLTYYRMMSPRFILDDYIFERLEEMAKDREFKEKRKKLEEEYKLREIERQRESEEREKLRVIERQRESEEREKLRVMEKKRELNLFILNWAQIPDLLEPCSGREYFKRWPKIDILEVYIQDGDPVPDNIEVDELIELLVTAEWYIEEMHTQMLVNYAQGRLQFELRLEKDPEIREVLKFILETYIDPEVVRVDLIESAYWEARLNARSKDAACNFSQPPVAPESPIGNNSSPVAVTENPSSKVNKGDPVEMGSETTGVICEIEGTQLKSLKLVELELKSQSTNATCKFLQSSVKANPESQSVKLRLDAEQTAELSPPVLPQNTSCKSLNGDMGLSMNGEVSDTDTVLSGPLSAAGTKLYQRGPQSFRIREGAPVEVGNDSSTGILGPLEKTNVVSEIVGMSEDIEVVKGDVNEHPAKILRPPIGTDLDYTSSKLDIEVNDPCGERGNVNLDLNPKIKRGSLYVGVDMESGKKVLEHKTKVGVVILEKTKTKPFLNLKTENLVSNIQKNKLVEPIPHKLDVGLKRGTPDQPESEVVKTEMCDPENRKIEVGFIKKAPRINGIFETLTSYPMKRGIG